MRILLGIALGVGLVPARVFLNTTNPEQRPDSVLAQQRITPALPKVDVSPVPAETTHPVPAVSTPALEKWLWLSPAPEDLNFQLGLLAALDRQGLRLDGIASAGKMVRPLYFWARGIPAESLWVWQNQLHKWKIPLKPSMAKAALFWEWRGPQSPDSLLESNLWQDRLILAQAPTAASCKSEQLLYDFEDQKWSMLALADSNYLWSQQKTLAPGQKWALPPQVWPEVMNWQSGRQYLQIHSAESSELSSELKEAWAVGRNKAPLHLMLPRRKMLSDSAEYAQGFAFGMEQGVWIQRTLGLHSIAETPELKPLGRWIWRLEGAQSDWWLGAEDLRLQKWTDLAQLPLLAQAHPNVRSAELDVDSAQSLVLRPVLRPFIHSALGLKGQLFHPMIYGQITARTLSPQALGAALETELGQSQKQLRARAWSEGIASQPLRTEVSLSQLLLHPNSMQNWTRDLSRAESLIWSLRAYALDESWEMGMQRESSLLSTLASPLNVPKLEEISFWAAQKFGSAGLDFSLKQKVHSASYQRFNANGAPLALALESQGQRSWDLSWGTPMVHASAGADLSYAALFKEQQWALAETLMADSGQVDTVANLWQALRIPQIGVDEYGLNSWVRSKAYAQLGLGYDKKWAKVWNLKTDYRYAWNRGIQSTEMLGISSVHVEIGVNIMQSELRALWHRLDMGGKSQSNYGFYLGSTF